MDSSEQGAMEDRNVQLDREFIEETALSEAELHSLIELFQLLDR